MSNGSAIPWADIVKATLGAAVAVGVGLGAMVGKGTRHAGQAIEHSSQELALAGSKAVGTAARTGATAVNKKQLSQHDQDLDSGIREVNERLARGDPIFNFDGVRLIRAAREDMTMRYVFQLTAPVPKAQLKARKAELGKPVLAVCTSVMRQVLDAGFAFEAVYTDRGGQRLIAVSRTTKDDCRP